MSSRYKPPSGHHLRLVQIQDLDNLPRLEAKITADACLEGFLTILGISHACKIDGRMMIFMNTSNPFQIPVCLQRADSQQRRRERFKRGFITGLAAIVVLLVGMLIEGCMTEKSTTPAPVAGETIIVQPAPQTAPTAGNVEQPSSHGSPTTLNPAQSSASSSPAMHTTVGSSTKTTYVVKSGDTLTRIAKVHGTTVKALKAANNLTNDRIVVGAKLKIPEA